jgi:secondary thiamine-phosphate synthase enzyme
MWIQKEITLPPKRRGFHLVTDEILNEVPVLAGVAIGMCHLFIQHTSASLAINENADPDVRRDMESYFSQVAPENEPYFTHILEGADDMPAHLKAVILGESLVIPIANGRLKMGLWQGIYLCEHRNQAGSRTIIITINGE